MPKYDYPLHPGQTHAEPLYAQIPLEEYESLKRENKRRAHNRYYASDKGKENRKGADARFRESHRTERNEYSRNYYREHKEYFAEYQKKYRGRKAA